jgi:xanthine dehydrogenase iron-sulfur cluster and FAD-binding subunit A
MTATSNERKCIDIGPGVKRTKALLDRNPNPMETEARYWLAGNLCRCIGYDKVIRAVPDAAAWSHISTRNCSSERGLFR